MKGWVSLDKKQSSQAAWWCLMLQLHFSVKLSGILAVNKHPDVKKIYLMNFANRHYFWGELLKQRPCSWHWLHRREDWTLPPLFPDTIINPLFYQFASLPMDPCDKRLLEEKISKLPSRQQSDFLFSQSFWQLQSSAWLSVNHQGPSPFLSGSQAFWKGDSNKKNSTCQ